MTRRQLLARRARFRKLLLESLENRVVLDGSPWHNTMSAFDVNHDGSVNTADQQALDSFLAANNGGPVQVPAQPDPDPETVMYYDVDDNWLVDDS
ncbi:MAG: hypothetical protein L0211_24595, partial [Planctomycetaceae bacterium]|nr:hypothetical protein [Planctomycetaceae bacterium]